MRPVVREARTQVRLRASLRCEFCATDRNHNRYIVPMAVSDYSGQAWFQGFNDVGRVVFGMSADELVEIRVSVSSCRSSTQRVLTDAHRSAMTPNSIRLLSARLARPTTSRAEHGRIHTTSVWRSLLSHITSTNPSIFATGSNARALRDFAHPTSELPGGGEVYRKPPDAQRLGAVEWRWRPRLIGKDCTLSV